MLKHLLQKKSGDGISNLANSLFSGFTARAYKDANTTYVH